MTSMSHFSWNRDLVSGWRGRRVSLQIWERFFKLFDVIRLSLHKQKFLNCFTISNCEQANRSRGAKAGSKVLSTGRAMTLTPDSTDSAEYYISVVLKRWTDKYWKIFLTLTTLETFFVAAYAWPREWIIGIWDTRSINAGLFATASGVCEAPDTVFGS